MAPECWARSRLDSYIAIVCVKYLCAPEGQCDEEEAMLNKSKKANI